eukprot:evm.model.scf_954.4 EVM.evm.TU.scf_954.4   scf_954:52040-52729(+)
MAVGRGEHGARLMAFVTALVQRGVMTDQFVRLLELQLDGENPALVSQLAELYIQETTERLDAIQSLVDAQEPDFSELDRLLHKFLGSSSTFGARIMVETSADLIARCQGRDVGGCRATLARIRQHFRHLKRLLGLYVELETNRSQNVPEGGEGELSKRKRGFARRAVGRGDWLVGSRAGCARAGEQFERMRDTWLAAERCERDSVAARPGRPRAVGVGRAVDCRRSTGT